MTVLLEVVDLHSGYGDLPVLHGVQLQVHRGQVVSVVGANGAGKTTLLRTIAGVVRPTSGSVLVDGVDLAHVPAHRVVEHGVVMVPEGRRLFPFLTVEENLRLGGFHKAARRVAPTTLSEVYDLFPRLKDRRMQLAGSLSGGEQQMCAIGRGLMARPNLLMLDEPSLGLAPIIVEQIFGLVRELSASGLTVLLVEQNVAEALELSSSGSILEQGTVTRTGTGPELLADPQLRSAYLGVA